MSQPSSLVVWIFDTCITDSDNREFCTGFLETENGPSLLTLTFH